MRQRSKISMVCAVLFLTGMAFPSAHANWFGDKWFGKKKQAENQAVEQVQTYQPPPENAVAEHCEPYRHEAAVLSQKPFFLKLFYAPKRGIAMHKHRECKKVYMEQERTYLKHVDIERPPSLPKLKTDTPEGPNTLATPKGLQDAIAPH